MNTYTNRSNAARAAKKAVEGTNNTYEVVVAAGGYSFKIIEPAAVKLADDEMALLTMGDTECGLVPLANAEREAQSLADETGEVVAVRHAITDVEIGTVHPTSQITKESDIPMTEMNDLTTGTDADTDIMTIPEDDAVTSLTATELQEETAEHTGDVVLPASTFPTAAHAEAWAKVDGLTKRQFEVIPVEGGYAFRKVVKAPKPVKAASSEGPTGKVAECIALALRPQGVTAKELNELTGWTGAPWRWNFSNPKNTGWAQKHGYDFEVKKEGGTVTYHLSAKAPEEVPEAA